MPPKPAPTVQIATTFASPVQHSSVPTLPAADAFDAMAGLGYARVQGIHGSTYQDNSTCIVIPSRGMIPYRVVAAWQALIAPMNQKRTIFWATGHEVGQAYNVMIENILAHPEFSKWKYVLTLEDDNLPPPDAHIRLIETMEAGKWDGVSALYWTKGDFNMPMAYGDPEHMRRTGQLEFKPRDVRAALAAGQVMEVNGIAMGCSLYRMDLFREIKPPWFVTVADMTPTGPMAFTQDLFFCQKARQLGKRFAVDMRVRVGHLDVNTGIVY